MGRFVLDIYRGICSYIGRITQAWTDFWWQPADPFCLCVMRWLVGWMSFYNLLVWGMDLESFVFPQGLNSAVLVRNYLDSYEGSYAQSFWFFVSPEWIYPIHYFCLAAALCFMIGLWTRVTGLLTMVALISYAYRARFSTYGLDQINIILTMYLILGPSGAYLSVDRLLQRFRSVRRQLLAGKSGEPIPVLPSLTANIATRLIQFHYCVIYMAAGMGKLQGDSWWDGSAMWRSFANAEYQTLDMTWLAYFPFVIHFLTHMTVAWELSFAFLIWRKLTRPIVILMGLGMHFGIGLMMGMWTFGTCMMFGYLAFIEPEALKRFFHNLGFAFWGSPQIRQIPVDLSQSAQLKDGCWKKAWEFYFPVQLVASTPVDDSATDDTAAEQENSGTWRKLLLSGFTDSETRQLKPRLQQYGFYVMQLTESRDLAQLLEQEEMLIPVVNLAQSEPEFVQDYLGSLLPLHLQNRPSVTVLQPMQGKWLDVMQLAGYQRLLYSPADSESLLRELLQGREAFGVAAADGLIDNEADQSENVLFS